MIQAAVVFDHNKNNVCNPTTTITATKTAAVFEHSNSSLEPPLTSKLGPQGTTLEAQSSTEKISSRVYQKRRKQEEGRQKWDSSCKMNYLRLSKGKRKPTGKELTDSARILEEQQLVSQTLSSTFIPANPAIATIGSKTSASNS